MSFFNAERTVHKHIPALPGQKRGEVPLDKENRTLADIAADQIVQYILDNGMEAGDRLPNEYELAEGLGVGRNTLREAIRRLVSRNVLEVRQGAGTFISDKHGIPEDPLGLTFLEDSVHLTLDLLDVRLMLEPEICASVARAATEEQLDTLRDLMRQMADRIDRGEEYQQLDTQMHRYLAEFSGNDVLRNLIPIITSSVKADIRLTNDENRQHTKQQHQQIVDAICRHDPAGARYGMITHLNTNREHLIRRIVQRSGEDED